ncbi:MAG: hypothetical protein J3R72DRAFT_208829 [Linnemannia gamsii]|nr:MAG: hypothetical protein J3R72DRAFT_208829 [Linnemannia gamsii]
MSNSTTSASRTAWSSDELSSQLHAMDSILDLAAQFNLAPSPSAATFSADPFSSSSSKQQETPPTPQQQLRSVKVADLVLDIERTRGQLAQMESQLRNIKKLQLANDFSSHSIDDRIRCLDDFSQQISLLHQNQAQLLGRLTRSSSSPFDHSNERGLIMMDPQYHRDFVNLFYRIQDEIPKIDGHLKALGTWKQDSGLMGRSSSSSSPSLVLQNDSTIDRLKTSLDGLTGLSQQQLEILEASSKLQANLVKVLQSSSSSSTTTSRK